VRRVLDILGLLAVLWVLLWLAVVAHAFQPPAEGAMGTFPLPAVTTQIGPAADWTATTGAQEQEFYYRVSQEHTYDFKGIQFFSLKSADGSATISVDGDVKLSAALKALEGQRVRLTLENATLTLRRVER
jgi:hypothetical protein